MTNTSPQKPFWQKLISRNSSSEKTAGVEDVKNSLVESIVQQVEEAEKQDEQLTAEKKQEQYAALSVANTLLTLAILLTASGWLFFYVMLSPGNYFHAKFESQNLTTELESTRQLSEKLKGDLANTKKFTSLLQVEKLASQLNEINLDDPSLNYHRPIGELVAGVDGAPSVYQTTNDQGSIVQIPESEVLTKENARDVAAEKNLTLLKELQATTGDLDKMKKSLDSSVREDYATLSKNLNAILLSEENFPTAGTKTYLTLAQQAARKILAQIKAINLKNLITDLKNQIDVIGLDNFDPQTKAVVTEVQSIIGSLSEKRPSSFEQALKSAKNVDLSVVKSANEAVYAKLASIIGDGAVHGDLASVASIAANLSRATLIGELKKNQIIWSDVIDRVTKITRYGADLKNDDGVIYADPRQDLDPTGTNIVITGYSGKLEKNTIEIRGSTKNSVQQNGNFALLADLIDALEASKYFYNVDGFSFSKNKSPLGDYYVPFNLKLSIQDPTVANPQDLQLEEVKTTTTNKKGETLAPKNTLAPDKAPAPKPDNAPAEKTAPTLPEKKVARGTVELPAAENARIDQIFLELRAIISPEAAPSQNNNTSNPLDSVDAVFQKN